MFQRFSKNRYGYSRWDGTQRIEGLDADDILNALSDDYMEGGNLQQALRRLMQNGECSRPSPQEICDHHHSTPSSGSCTQQYRRC